jgi:hypothetical protein
VPTRDQRTVGELLADSDALSRDTLLDVTPSQGPAMVRAWSPVVQSAAQLWAVLPPVSLAAPSGPDLMVRLRGLGEGIARSTAGHWPGPGPQDQRLLEIALNLSRARDLVESYGGTCSQPEPRRGRTLRLPAPVSSTRCTWALTVQLLRSGTTRTICAIAYAWTPKGAGPSDCGRRLARSRRRRPCSPASKSSSSWRPDMCQPTPSLPAFSAKFTQTLHHRGCSRR